MNANFYSSSLMKAFDVLNSFENDRQELGIKQISQAVNMPQSSVHRIIQSLELRGLIFQNAETKKYRLGPMLSLFADKCSSMENYFRIANKYMQILASESDETVNLGILDGSNIILAHRIECHHVLRPNFTLRASYPAFKTGLGMVLLAELSDSSLQIIYQNNSNNIGISFESFMSSIKKIRSEGFACDDQVFCKGLRCVAAPIRGPGGNPLFSVSISSPTLRFDDKKYKHFVNIITKYAKQASLDIQEL